LAEGRAGSTRPGLAAESNKNGQRVNVFTGGMIVLHSPNQRKRDRWVGSRMSNSGAPLSKPVAESACVARSANGLKRVSNVWLSLITPSLLKGLREKSLKIPSEVFPLPFLNRVAAKLDYLKVFQVVYAIHCFPC